MSFQHNIAYNITCRQNENGIWEKQSKNKNIKMCGGQAGVKQIKCMENYVQHWFRDWYSRANTNIINLRSSAILFISH